MREREREREREMFVFDYWVPRWTKHCSDGPLSLSGTHTHTHSGWSCSFRANSIVFDIISSITLLNLQKSRKHWWSTVCSVILHHTDETLYTIHYTLYTKHYISYKQGLLFWRSSGIYRGTFTSWILGTMISVETVMSHTSFSWPRILGF